MSNELRQSIFQTAQRLGIDPTDLATVMSYETAGTFDPWKKGPTTQWGQHRGLIQWGEPQRKKYGVYEGMPVSEQVQAAGNYLKDAGVQPGMGILDVYSAINAGRVGRYNASDANNGGAPGTVRDKVENQMGGHRTKAQMLLGQPHPPLPPGAPAPPLPEPITVGAAPATPVKEDAPAGVLALLAGDKKNPSGLNGLMQSLMMSGADSSPQPVQMAPMPQPKIPANALSELVAQFLQGAIKA